MGTIVERKNKSGSKFRAQAIKKDEGKIVLTTSATFARKSTAAAWIKRIERDFAAGKLSDDQANTSVRELIDQVIKLNRKDMGNTKSKVSVVRGFEAVGRICAKYTTM